MKNIPDFLKHLNREFIAIDDRLFQIKIEFIDFSDFDPLSKYRLASELEANLKAQVALDSLGIEDEEERIHQYGLCRYGGFDDKADFEGEDIVNHEFYKHCPKRQDGSCPLSAQRHLCQHLSVKNGVITPSEIRLLMLLANSKDLSDLELAKKLGVSHHTVLQHFKNIKKKIGVTTKTELAKFAIQKNL